MQVAKGAGRYDLRQTFERILAAHLLNKAPFKSNGDYSSGGTNHCTSRRGSNIAEGHDFFECSAQYGTVCHQHK